MASDWVAVIERAVLEESEGLDENLVGSLIRSALPTVRATKYRPGQQSELAKAIINRMGKGGGGGDKQAASGALVQASKRTKSVKGSSDPSAKQARLWYLKRKEKQGSISSSERTELALLQQKRKSGGLAKVNRGARAKQPNPKGMG